MKKIKETFFKFCLSPCYKLLFFSPFFFSVFSLKTIFIIQRKFRVGYTRAGRIMAEMESKGILDASTGIVKRKN